MKKFLLGLAVVCMFASPAGAEVYVRGHNRGGAYVPPHRRSTPDHSYNNNWSVRPNVNPYTQQQGTLEPTWNDRPPQQSSFGQSPFEMAPSRPSSSMMRSSLYNR